MKTITRLLAVLAAWGAGTTVAAPPPVTLVPVGSGFSLPVEITTPRDGSGRLFVVEQGGRIRILQSGAILPTAFLDLSTGGILSTGGERGLLGLAFHPDYAVNRAFYIYYTKAGTGNLAVARVLRRTDDANRADPASRVDILEIPHTENSNHNGGKIAFGPDGFLYIGTGDGGGGGDPLRNGQNRASRLGKLLRLAVDGGTGYTIPAGNPYAGQTCAGGFCPEILHYGLRNPWKFSFDRMTGDLFIADVGQDVQEEVNFIPAATAPGQNFGWGVWEGNRCYRDTYFGPAGACAATTSHFRPILTYNHDENGGDSITGGFRYRGRSSAALRGWYLYGDYVSSRFFAARPDAGGAWVGEQLLPANTVSGLSTFAEDEQGEMYAVDYGAGIVHRIQGPLPRFEARTDFNGDDRNDIVLRNATNGSAYVWSFNGATFLRDDPLFQTDPAWRIAGVGDFNRDGKPDLVLRHAQSGSAFIWFMDGRRFVSDVALFSADPAWVLVGVADIDGDGHDDLVMRNASSGLAFAWLMNGSTITGSRFLFSIDPEWKIVGFGDFNGDGSTDVVFRSRTSGAAYAWFLNGGAFIADAPLFTVDPVWEVALIADFNGDSRPDIVLRHRDSGNAYAWFYNGTTRAGDQFLFGVDPSWEVAPSR